VPKGCHCGTEPDQKVPQKNQKVPVKIRKVPKGAKNESAVSYAGAEPTVLVLRYCGEQGP
jgi:hypothetical protein